MWTLTNERDVQYLNSGNPLLDFFSKAGSAFEKRTGYYENTESALDLFTSAWSKDELRAFKLMLWLRDCRGGAGNRSGFRSILTWMANNHTEWVEKNMHWIPEIGRWDDLRALFNTPLQVKAGHFWFQAIRNGNVLAAKWADRSDFPVRRAAGMKIGPFRRWLAGIRKSHIVEHKMCSKEWQNIEYEKVPSVAMSRYSNAFMKNDESRFTDFKSDVKSGKKTVKTAQLFPHDCVRNCRYGDSEMAELQFNEMPNIEKDSMTMVITDTSGSMGCQVTGSIQAIDISMGLALYFSGKVDEDNPFYKRFIQFNDEGKFTDWRGMTFSEAVKDRRIFDRAVASTRIDKALDTILSIAQKYSIEQELMPRNLLIVSDMQFTEASDSGVSAIETALRKWDKAGYKRPAIVFWNVSPYYGSPATYFNKNTAMISGFSTDILKSVLGSDTLDPLSIMDKALEKYSEVVVP